MCYEQRDHLVTLGSFNMMLFYVTYVAKATACVLGITSEKGRSQQLNLIRLYQNKLIIYFW